MTNRRRTRRGIWYHVGRPFRALGRALESFELIGFVVQLGRGIVWLFHGTERLVARLVDH